MDYDKLLNETNYFDQRIFAKVAELERAKVTNEEREKLSYRRSELEDLNSSFERYMFDLKLFDTALDQEDRKFKNRRTEYIDGLITESLRRIFPTDNLQAKLECDFYRKSEAHLVLRDGDGHELDPDICSGKLQQYLVSFTAVSGIVKGLGIKNLYVDEAFGVAAPEIMGEIGKVVQHSVDDGLQIIMIAQNPCVYQDLPRHEITLKKDPVTKSVHVVSEIDY